MLINEIIHKYRFSKNADRIGPDILFSHWKLHFNSLILKLCKKKFKFFSDNAQFRPEAYAAGCSKIYIGNRVVIRPQVMLFGETLVDMEYSICIEDDVLMGSGVHIYVNDHKFSNPNILIIDQGYYPGKPVILKKGCWIGANVMILPGVIIGENSVVGAGSIVLRSIPAGVVAVGNPCIVIKRVDENEI